eukprot:2956862-Rhodomonas_salina.1
MKVHSGKVSMRIFSLSGPSFEDMRGVKKGRGDPPEGGSSRQPEGRRKVWGAGSVLPNTIIFLGVVKTLIWMAVIMKEYFCHVDVMANRQLLAAAVAAAMTVTLIAVVFTE